MLAVLSRKRDQSQENEVRAWHLRQQLERDAAIRAAEAQRKRQIPPGFVRLQIDDDEEEP